MLCINRELSSAKSAIGNCPPEKRHQYAGLELAAEDIAPLFCNSNPYPVGNSFFLIT